MEEVLEIDIAIIGGGIIGLTAALEISNRFKNLDIALFEKEQYLGDQTTGRNSGVLHAGIYYPNNSKKHIYCIEGNEIWTKLAQDLEIPINRCGKFIVATKEGELTRLNEIFNQAKKNNVPGIREATTQEKIELRKDINVADALFSPATGILGVPDAVKKIEAKVFNNNVPILLNNPVSKLSKSEKGFLIQTVREEFLAKVVINCAGLHALNLRRQLGLNDLSEHWVKGNYLKFNGIIHCNSLIYPIPPEALNGLGVHSTMDIDNQLRFGPNTELIDSINYAVTDKVIEDMWPSINQLFINVKKEQLTPDYSGIRPRVKRSEDSTLISDFLLQSERDHKIKGYIELLGIESPGITASPAIAKWIAKQIENYY